MYTIIDIPCLERFRDILILHRKLLPRKMILIYMNGRHETPVLSKPIELVHLSDELVVLDKPCSLPVSKLNPPIDQGLLLTHGFQWIDIVQQCCGSRSRSDLIQILIHASGIGSGLELGCLGVKIARI
jgi:hypothetical protein